MGTIILFKEKKMNETETTLKLISGILLRSFIVAVVLLILWLVICLALGDFWYPIHSQLLDLTVPEVKLLHYNGIMFLRTLTICFLFCPFVAIEMVVRFKKKQ